jgi:hypothetical protein
MLLGGLSPGQPDGISIIPSSVSIPQEIDLFLEYVTNFICQSFLEYHNLCNGNGNKNNLNFQQESFLILI